MEVKMGNVKGLIKDRGKGSGREGLTETDENKDIRLSPESKGRREVGAMERVNEKKPGETVTFQGWETLMSVRGGLIEGIDEAGGCAMEGAEAGGGKKSGKTVTFSENAPLYEERSRGRGRTLPGKLRLHIWQRQNRSASTS
jgi:hypothetical protein